MRPRSREVGLPPGWFEVLDPARAAAQLRRELSPGHPLFGVEVVFVARRLDRDDVAVRTPDGRLAVVHLTYADHALEPPFPSCAFVDALDDEGFTYDDFA